MKRTREILADYGYQPKKSRGQNFLVQERVLKRIVDCAHIKPSETVIEIGPGTGGLTRRLVRAAKKVVAIELDSELATILKAELAADNLEVVQADALETEFADFAAPGERLKVIANLPYNISAPILFKLIDSSHLFSELLLLVQLEVAERIAAPPGKKPYGILAARAQLVADARVLFEVAPSAFRPRPKVTSALVRLRMLEKPRAEVQDMEMFKRVVRGAFARRRKTLRNSFSEELLGCSREAVTELMTELGIAPSRRAETVTVSEFASLANALSRKAGRDA